ncbi:hypothetical protein Cenrod_1745 [Candidatus Symbiobacter mobilis CR]|uniref:Uncharacterized protein n=1 Tax=Candidatus Symbiobacter mobilis CR TaxID=946483 RepID=U5NCF7_9BURK|nr:hypothetical protein Cenrod_1745 [Candidatus Symbiobacter mobilis CR]
MLGEITMLQTGANVPSAQRFGTTPLGLAMLAALAHAEETGTDAKPAQRRTTHMPYCCILVA